MYTDSTEDVSQRRVGVHRNVPLWEITEEKDLVKSQIFFVFPVRSKPRLMLPI